MPAGDSPEMHFMHILHSRDGQNVLLNLLKVISFGDRFHQHQAGLPQNAGATCQDNPADGNADEGIHPMPACSEDQQSGGDNADGA
ncbi:hypothetical protein D3C75_1225840 [compost metagenome]